jgi:DNA primase
MSEETELIKDRLDIAEVVNEYVPLKRTGGYFKACCPFHQEKTPSFVVSPDKGIWHCFGCFPPGQQIKTPFGYHNIETIDDNHYVISGRGNFKKVLANHSRNYDGELVNIRLRKLSYPVSLTVDHKVFLVRGAPSTRSYKVFARRYRKYLQYRNEGQYRKYREKVAKYFPICKVPANEIRKGDLFLYPIDKCVEDIKSIDLEKYLDKPPRFGPRPPAIPLKIKINEDFLKLIGYYVAEGSNHRAYIRFSLGNHEEEFARDIVRLIKTIFKLSASIHRRSGNRTGIEITVCHAHLANIFGNLMGKGAGNKHIPFVLQRLSSNWQRVLVRAIHRGDGTDYVANRSNKKHSSITTISKVLAEQIVDSLLRDGIFPKVYVSAKYNHNGVRHRQSYIISWSVEANSRYNMLYYHEGSTYWVLPLLSLSRTPYKGPVHNITVENDHSYVASSFAVANCGDGGDVFSFVEKIENMDFVSVLKMLAERTGVELKKQSKQSSDRRQRMFDVMELAARFYHEVLMNQSVGNKAKEYLKKRGVKEKTMQAFQLGYAPKQWDTLQNFLRARGYSPQEMLAVGLVGESQRSTLYDRFRGRIIFPIQDLQGRTVAFGGRVVPWHETGEEGKYVNSPETELYEKRRVVYNLERAKQFLRHNAPCLVVEGYMDVVMVEQAGIRNVVASSGTAFTEEQVQQLKRFTQQLHFSFDADAAGTKAAISATEVALTVGMRVATVLLPAGKDPADVALQSPKKLNDYLKKPKSLVLVLMKRFEKVKDGVAKEKYLQELLPLIARIDNPVYQGEMVQELAEALHVPEARIVNQLQQVPVEKPVDTSFSSGLKDNVREEEAVVSPDRHLMGLMVAYSIVRKELFFELKEFFIVEEEAKALYKVMHELAKREKEQFVSMSADNLLERVPMENVSYGEGARRMSEERVANSSEEPEEEGRVLLQALKKRYLKSRLEQLQRDIAQGKKQEQAKALREFKKVTQELAQVV